MHVGFAINVINTAKYRKYMLSKLKCFETKLPVLRNKTNFCETKQKNRFIKNRETRDKSARATKKIDIKRPNCCLINMHQSS